MRTSFVIIDETGTFSADDLAKAAHACQVQLNRDFAPVWGGDYAVRVSDGSDIHDGEVIASIQPSEPDAPTAVAYHSVAGNSVPFIRVSLAMLGTGFPLSVALSHEFLEEAADPGCNFWADDFGGKSFSLEVCDATESDWYDIDGTKVSNFLYPAFFEPGHVGPYSHIGAATGTDPVSAPFVTAPGGYQDSRTVTDQQTSTTNAKGQTVHYPGALVVTREYGAGYPEARKAVKEARRANPHSRAAKRHRGPHIVIGG